MAADERGGSGLRGDSQPSLRCDSGHSEWSCAYYCWVMAN